MFGISREKSNVKVVAEIGCNHKGDIMIAREMIKIAAIFCEVDAVKFQKRHPCELLSIEEYNAPHPVEYHAYGKTYGEHREYLEFSREEHQELKECCEEYGLIYSTSVWDMTSAQEIVSLNPEYIKIPSAINTNYRLLGYLCDNYRGDIHASLGMTTREEEEKMLNFFKNKGRNKDLVVYSCTSGYPVPFEDVCLMEIKRIKDAYGKEVKGIGFSGHHNGIAIDVASLVLGAEWVERHYTLNRTWKGTDHAASLEPDGLRRLVRDLRNTEKALGYKENEILKIEEAQRKKLKWLR
jgi:N-acetylneuraminate synthase